MSREHASCIKCGRPVTRWSFTDYKLLQIMPVTDMLAVYAEQADLVADPIYFLALAEATTKHMQIHDDGSHQCEYARKDVHNEVVGLDLCEGYFTVTNEASNFAGLCRVGDDIDLATGCLVWGDYPACREVVDARLAAKRATSP